MNSEQIEELIKRRRLQLLVHSVIYYRFNTNIVSDAKWSRWAKELVELQKKYPDESKKVRFYDLFADWDGSTGFDLDVKADDAAIGKARYLLIGRKKI